MNTKIAVAVGVAAILASVFALPQPAFAAEVKVDIPQGSSTKTNDAYVPNPVEINVGDTVTWTNNDPGQFHSATSGTGGTPDNMFGNPNEAASLLKTGASMSFTFNEAGEYPYYCFLHPNMVGTVKVAGGAMGGPFTVLASLDGTNYNITGKSETVKATAASIEAGKAVKVTFDKAGEVELTLPKTMISGINAVMAGDAAVTFNKVSETDTATTISFTVPEGSTAVDIMGTTVVPEFPLVAALILGASIAAIVGYTRIRGNWTGLFGRV